MREDVLIDRVLTKCDALKRAGLWAREPVRPQAWLGNFHGDEKVAAAVMLDHFVFFSNDMTRRTFVRALRRLKDGPLPRSASRLSHSAMADAVFLPVLGEEPNPSDSGYAFCRMARQAAGVAEDRLVEPAAALNAAVGGKPVVFLDDFVGSGEQMKKMWSRALRTTAPHSFEEAYAASVFPAFYVTLVATAEGLSHLASHAAGLVVVAVHVLDAQYKITNISYSELAPAIPSLGALIDSTLAKHAPNLSVASYMQSSGQRKLGFQELGLLFAFEHSVPDATVPLLWAENNSASTWTPLVRRT